MNEKNPVSAYQKAAAAGATPVGIVVALYDTILRDFRRALEALDAGNIQFRVFELNHALSVIAHLQNTLDFTRGHDAAKTFDRFYHVTRGMIVAVNARADRTILLQLIEMYGSLRQAWQEVDRKLPAAQQLPQVPSSNSSIDPAPSSAVPLEEPPHRATWSA
jgi:flagellar protein FliS